MCVCGPGTQLREPWQDDSLRWKQEVFHVSVTRTHTLPTHTHTLHILTDLQLLVLITLEEAPAWVG